ncbi:MAG: hypothetical protein KAU38_15775 [Desulfobacterales bacterium]|nr:hypothetical protein [Desulfobacterales bacterium]
MARTSLSPFVYGAEMARERYVEIPCPNVAVWSIEGQKNKDKRIWYYCHRTVHLRGGSQYRSPTGSIIPYSDSAELTTV